VAGVAERRKKSNVLTKLECAARVAEHCDYTAGHLVAVAVRGGGKATFLFERASHLSHCVERVETC
jgi:hypothetical protein